MTLDQYNEGLKNLKKEYDNKVNDLVNEYALSNNPYKIGDIISSKKRGITIKITAIKGEPPCYYEGIRIKKDGTPTKNQTDNFLYQSWINE